MNFITEMRAEMAGAVERIEERERQDAIRFAELRRFLHEDLPLLYRDVVMPALEQKCPVAGLFR